ncbi:MAG TPA: formylmethanofuran dehydrogenase subunit E family protein [Syntrophorhabdaceae bacterium]|nr:formylmethanofuran dehydrogenase subunit E family protein [Syntrophorhabdaceae bacterium]HRR72378.1 formylmethanofuran dehydrogenase subunit E family protein [Syntrophorhabdaceae bacterium]
MKTKTLKKIVFSFVWLFFLLYSSLLLAHDSKAENSPDWYFPDWAASAKYNTPIKVLDTDSALGRYSLKTKEIGLKDIVKYHGHMCDGLVIAYVEINGVLKKLFPNGIVDRTDLRAVSKNGPCWVDTITYMTGARINFQTLRIDNSIGDGFIIQRISTGEAYSVHLKPGIFPKDQAELEAKIRKLRAEGKPVTTEDINTVEKMADALSLKLLTTPPEELLDIKPLKNYRFVFTDMFGNRGDIINKNMPR